MSLFFLTIMRIRHLRATCLSVLFVCLLSLQASEAPYATPMQTFTIANGLYNNQARHVMELPNGRILVMTEGMPCLYDGYQFHPMRFDLNKTVKIESFFNTDHYFDRSGLLWIRNLHNLVVYNTRTLRQMDAKSLLKNSGLTDRQMRNFFIDDYGNAWMHMSDDNLYIYDWQHAARRVLSTTERNIEGLTPSVCDIVQAGRQMFIILSDGKMSCWDHISHKLLYTLRIEDQKVAFQLKALGHDSESFILRTTAGLFLFNTTTREKTQFFADPHVTEMTHASDGSLWVSSEKLTQFDSQLRLKRNIEQAVDRTTGRPLKNFTCILSDRLGGVWACTQNGGVGYLSPNEPVISFHPVFNGAGNPVNIRSFAKMGKSVFVGTNNGLYTYSPADDELVYYPGPLGLTPCVSLRPDADGRHLWVTNGQGEIHFLDTQTGHTDSYLPSNVQSLWGNIPFCVSIGGGDFLTSIRMNRLSVFTPAKHQLNNLTDRFPELLQYRYTVDATPVKGGIIVGSQNGFYFFDTKHRSIIPGRLKSLNANAFSNKCNCMLADRDGTVWIGTQNGLLHYDPAKDTFTRLSKTDGLPNSCILSLAFTPDRRLWVATANGIALVSTENIFQFGQADGLQDADLNERAALVLDDGRVLFGSDQGFYVADLKQMHMPKVALKPQITNISIMNDTTMEYAKSVDVTYDKNNIRFFVSALNYLYPQHTRYRYRLQGAETNWNECVGEKGRITISYNMLPPGIYRLEVQCAFQDQPWSASLTFPIHISPPWWKTWWAWTLYVLATICLAAFFIHQYIRARNRRLDYLRRIRIQHDHEELNKDRLRFFTNVTHELRTPLTLILSPAEDLYADPTLSEHARKSVTSIRNSAQRMLTLVEQLLEFRKMDQKQRKLNLKKGQLDEFVLNVFSQFAGNNKNRKLQFTQEIDHVGMNVWFDSDIVQTILNNLLSNAIKYTPRGFISLHLTNEADNTVVLSISDTGYGIPAQALPHIFERYYQVNDRHQASGTGIGLALAQSLAELHHAKIKAESQVNKGSTFSLVFSRAELEHPDGIGDGSEAVEPVKNASDTVNDKEPQGAEALPKSFTAHDPIVNNKRNLVLVVEDNDDIRQYIVDSLDEFDCLQASNGRIGLKMAKENIPDFIVSDIMIPEMDGNEMCRLLKQDIKTCHIPIIMLTAKSSMNAVEEGYESGAAAYLTKPFTAKMLTALLGNLVRQRTYLLERMLRNSNLNTGFGATKGTPETGTRPAANEDDKQAVPYFSDDADAEEPSQRHDEPSLLSAMDRQFIDKFDTIIEENIDNSSLDILYICDKMAMSRTSLYRKVKGLLGISANEYIRKRRLQRAYQMLQSERFSKNTIAGIAYDCGFSSISYFRSCFKEEFGILPGEVQKHP